MEEKAREKRFSEIEIIIEGHGGNFDEKSLILKQGMFEVVIWAEDDPY